MQKKFLFLGIVVIITVITAMIIKKKGNDIEIYNAKSYDLTSFDIKSFSDNARWKNGALIGDDLIIYEFDKLCFNDLRTGKGGVLCSLPGCLHNNDDCMAQFSYEGSTMGIYSYKGKLYDVTKGREGIILYRCDFDGSNHETVSRLQFSDKNYDVIEDVSCLYDGNGVYLGITLGDESKSRVLDDGTMTDWPVIGKVIYMSFESGEATEICTLEDGYQGFLELQQLTENKIYFEYQLNSAPYEEQNNQNNTDLSYTAYIDIENKDIHKLDDRTYGDFIGFDGTNTFVKGISDDRKLTGEVLIINYSTGEIKNFWIDEAKDVRYCDGEFALIDSGVVFNNEYGIFFYDLQGKKTDYVESEELNIIGESNKLYLLSPKSVASGCMSSYIPKEEIKQINEKSVSLFRTVNNE